jgi:3-oxoacyl-ACP reductase-like protein
MRDPVVVELLSGHGRGMWKPLTRVDDLRVRNEEVVVVVGVAGASSYGSATVG